MARIAGLEPHQTPFFMRLVFGRFRKLFGKDLTPYTIQARVPRVFWISIITEALLGQRAQVSRRLRSIAQLRTASRVGCPF
ncbi:MAG TPA: hypothetical protein VL919_03555 [Vicinamibacterales bacterium]|jgi:hypothetical protein|nr:hypothetical protein [Vicinamibacterales bacterium]